jgi:predicted HicB family RNase H-like nuclease
MTTLNYNGYVAKVTYDEGDQDMHGVVTNTAATLHFAGRSIDELKQAFADTVNEYVAWCHERGKDPEKPYTGNVSLRIPPTLHRALATSALDEGTSVNNFIARLLEDGMQRRVKEKT